MKILLISLSNNYDHQLSLYSLFDGLNKKSEDVYTLGITNPKYSFAYCEKNLFVDCPKKPGITKGSFNIFKLSKLYKQIKKMNFDVIYFESLHLWNIYLIKKLKKRCKIFHCIHDVIPHDGKMSRLVNLFNNFIYKNAYKVIVRSKEAYIYCKNNKTKYFKKISFLPLLRKWNDFVPCKSTNNVLFFGRITKYKGLENLLIICSKLPNVHFNIVGKAIESDDQKQLEGLKQLSNVTVVDEYVDEETMINYFKMSDCVILPYMSATQSGVIVDAYSYSRPCIAFSVGGIKEQIIDGVTGVLVANNDITDFKNAIQRFISFPFEKKENICLSAYLFGKQNYSIDSFIYKIISLFYERKEGRQHDFN